MYKRKLLRSNFRFSRKDVGYLVLGILSLVLCISIIVIISPSTVVNIGSLRIPIVTLVLLAIFIFFFSFATFFLHNKKHGLLLGTFILVFLLFRIFDFVHPLFLFLLIALFLSLELLLSSGQHKEIKERQKE